MCDEEGIRLGIASHDGQVVFLIDAPDRCQRIVAMQLANAFPGGRIEVFNDPSQDPKTSSRWLRLSPDVFPLKQHAAFVEGHSREAIDPLESLLEAIKSGRSGRVRTEFWLELLPRKRKEGERAELNSRYLDARFRLRLLKCTFMRSFSRSDARSRLIQWLIRRLTRVAVTVPDEVADKLKRNLYSITIRFAVSSDSATEELANRKTAEIASALKLVTHPNSIFFVEKKPNENNFQLSSPEIATLWHFPTVAVHVPRLDKQTFRELEPPPNLPRPGDSPDILTLGRVCFRNERYKFGMDIEARRRHLWILGKTGMGKTTLLQSIIKQDLDAGRGFAVLEPHGDLAENTLKLVPRRRKNDIVFFDAADLANKVTFNPLMVPKRSDKTLVADGVLSAFQKIFGLDEGEAPRLLHIFRNCLLSLVEMPGSTLIDVQRILVEPIYRKTVISRVSNPVVRSFWLDEFGKWKPNDRTAFIASLQNKLGAFLTNEKLQRVLGDPKAKLDLRKIMDEGKVLIVNLSKGRLGENASNLLGTLIVTSLQLAAMSRANIPESDRRDFSIIMDEFQNFTSPSIATFLSEARKYRTHLIIANQFTQQIPEDILAAIFGNVGSQLFFRLGFTDGELFGHSFEKKPSAIDLVSLPPFQGYFIPQGSNQTSPFSFCLTAR